MKWLLLEIFTGLMPHLLVSRDGVFIYKYPRTRGNNCPLTISLLPPALRKHPIALLSAIDYPVLAGGRMTSLSVRSESGQSVGEKIESLCGAGGGGKIVSGQSHPRGLDPRYFHLCMNIRIRIPPSLLMCFTFPLTAICMSGNFPPPSTHTYSQAKDKHEKAVPIHFIS